MQLDATGERRRRALTSLSTTGAGVAGVGFGALLAALLEDGAWPLLIGGLLVHLVGMSGLHRATLGTVAPPARWEQWLYWSCWTIVAAGAVYVLAAVAL